MPERDLVVFIPGLMATALTRQRLITTPAVVWKNDAHLLVYGPDALDLGADGVSPGPLASGPLSPGDFATPSYYAPLLAQLAADQWDVQIWQWDWRKSLRASVAGLAAFLRDGLAGRPFWIVAHSAGGLLARLAYAAFAAAGGTTAWQRTLYFGTPHGGSYVPCLFAGGALPPLGDWSALVVGCGLGFRRLTSPWLTLRPLPERIRQVLSSWPSLWELTPNTGDQWAALDPNAFETEQLRNYLVSNQFAVQAQVNRGVALRAELNTLLAQPRPSEVCIAGRGTSTVSKLKVNPVALYSDNGYELTNEGDGVVTVERATLEGIPTIVEEADHHEVLIGGATLSRLSLWLTGFVPVLVTLPDNPLPGIAVKSLGLPEVKKNTIDFPFPALQRRGDP